MKGGVRCQRLQLRAYLNVMIDVTKFPATCDMADDLAEICKFGNAAKAETPAAGAHSVRSPLLSTLLALSKGTRTLTRWNGHSTWSSPWKRMPARRTCCGTHHR